MGFDRYGWKLGYRWQKVCRGKKEYGREERVEIEEEVQTGKRDMGGKGVERQGWGYRDHNGKGGGGRIGIVGEEEGVVYGCRGGSRGGVSTHGRVYIKETRVVESRTRGLGRRRGTAGPVSDPLFGSEKGGVGGEGPKYLLWPTFRVTQWVVALYPSLVPLLVFTGLSLRVSLCLRLLQSLPAGFCVGLS